MFFRWLCENFTFENPYHLSNHIFFLQEYITCMFCQYTLSDLALCAINKLSVVLLQNVVLQLVETQILTNMNAQGILIDGFPRDVTQVHKFEEKVSHDTSINS